MGAGSAIRSRAGLPPLVLAVLAALAALLVAAPAAQAQFGVDPDDWIAQVFGTDAEVFDVASDQYGEPGIFDQAGGHPWKGITDFTFRTNGSGDPEGGNASNIRVDVPPGLVPNPTLFPRCPRVVFDGAGSCPPDTQIGIEELTVKEGSVVARVRVSLYNVEIAPDQVSLFGFRPADAPAVAGLAALADVNPVYIVGGVRDQPSQFGPHDNGLFFTIDDAPETPAVLRSKLTFWGVPGDPVHNARRAQSCATVLAPLALPEACLPPVTNVPSTVPDLPFLSNPTKCGGAPLITRLSLVSHLGAFDTVDDQTPTIDGKDGAQHCDRVPFAAGIDVAPDTTQPDAPVGPRVRLSTPQPGLEDKDVLTTSHVKDVSVTLPPGMTLNPSAANGLVACSDAQLAANTGAVGGDECPEASKVGTVDVKSPLLPFLTTPTLCAGVKLETKLLLTSQVGEQATASSFTPTTSNGGEGPQNCAAVPFAGGFDLTPDTTLLDAPTGPLANLSMAQDGLLDPNGIAPSHVDDVTVALPPGLTLNPSVANGLVACTDEQLGKGTSNPIACPEASAIGTVSIDTPLLADPLQGTAYVGQPLPGDQYRLFVTAAGNGVSARFIGSARPDPVTGQLTAVFPDNPQTPFENFTVDFRDGPLAPLATPWDCGPKTSMARYTAYSGAPDATPSSTFESGGPGCQPLGFGPGFSAGTDNALAGAFSPFHALIVRDDRNQFLDGVRVKLPPGLLGMVSRVDQCSDTAAARGDCSASSRIGTASVLAGAGSQPFPLSGPVYLTGPYQGGSFGIAVVIRALAGPYDLGTVVVRQPIFVDPDDARLTIPKAPLPRILEGVPVRLRSVDIDVDRAGFMLNPTSCAPKEIRATLHSTEGAALDRAVPFQVGNCQALAFGPRISMRMTGKKQMRRGKHPGLRARVVQARGQANIGQASVKLPLSLALDPDNARSICSYEGGQQARCPGSAKIGRATAISPALDDPLKGVVYFVQGIRVDPATGARIRTLPTLLVKLKGEVRISLRATTTVKSRKLVTSFTALPDVPLSRFYLRLKGGSGGILAATRNDICDRKQFARARFGGQNGKRASARVQLGRPCKPSKSQARKGA